VWACGAQAVQLVKEVADGINQEVADFENQRTILDLSATFSSDPEFVAPARAFVKQGFLVKHGRKAATRYEFFLFNVRRRSRALAGAGRHALVGELCAAHDCVGCCAPLFSWAEHARLCGPTHSAQQAQAAPEDRHRCGAPPSAVAAAASERAPAA
jgi:hypothetical protein